VPHGHRSFALILVLLAAAALFAVALHVAVTARAGTVEARVLGERAAALREARSAASIVLTSLGTTPERFASQSGTKASSNDGDSPPESDDQPEEPELPAIIKELIGKNIKDVEDQAKAELEQQDRQVQGGGISGRSTGRQARERLRFTVVPPRPVVVRVREGGVAYRISVADALSQMNINEASRDQMLAYLAAKEVPFDRASAIAAQVIDWRDEDSSAEPGGAEQAQYTPRGIACRDASMTMLEELLYLPAMTPEIFVRIRPDLTTFGDSRVHVGSASRAVLMSLPGIDIATADAIIEAREAGPITDQILDRLLPIRARDSRDKLRVDPGGVLRLRIETIDAPGPAYEGLAVLSDKGGVQALGLRAVYE
jgi:hypothetical protein